MESIRPLKKEESPIEEGISSAPPSIALVHCSLKEAIVMSVNPEEPSPAAEEDQHNKEGPHGRTNDPANKDDKQEVQPQELMRGGLNWFMSFAISFTVCAVVPGLPMLYNFGLSAGGPVIMRSLFYLI